MNDDPQNFKARVWVNQKFLDTAENKKLEKWKPAVEEEKVLYGLCACGAPIYEGDSVGMKGEHEIVVCYKCWMSGEQTKLHLDCAGLKLPGIVLSN